MDQLKAAYHAHVTEQKIITALKVFPHNDWL